MNNVDYSLIFSFDSGKQEIFEDNNAFLSIQDNYRSEFLLTPRVFGLSDDIKYYSLLRINTNEKANAQDYINFKDFCNKILNYMENGDNITNFVLKDNDGNVYYNITKENLIGIDAEGVNNIDTSNKLSFRIYLYRRKSEE